MRLRVSEVFGPTFQGEGPSVGRACSFVRLGGCNLHCSWCDTPYTWDWTGRNGTPYDPQTELYWASAEALWADVEPRGGGMLVLSGGEPLLQQNAAMVELLSAAKRCEWRVELETAGTVAPTPEVVKLVDQFNVSPKLANSGNDAHKRYRPEAIDALRDTGRSVWKFVAQTADDLIEVEAYVAKHAIENVWIMPEGTTSEQINECSRRLVDGVLARNWNLATRLHVHLYGPRRGI